MSDRRAIFKPCVEPGRATVEQGIVILDGPDGVAVAMTPECAERTAASLRKAALEASAGAGSAGSQDGPAP